jgi:hypothetical protein
MTACPLFANCLFGTRNLNGAFNRLANSLSNSSGNKPQSLAVSAFDDIASAMRNIATGQ